MKILGCKGEYVMEADAKGQELPDGGVPWPVWGVLSYKVREGATQALRVDVYGRSLMGWPGREDRIELDNGIVLQGSLVGRKVRFDKPNAISHCNLVDVDVEGGCLITQGVAKRRQLPLRRDRQPQYGGENGQDGCDGFHFVVSVLSHRSDAGAKKKRRPR